MAEPNNLESLTRPAILEGNLLQEIIERYQELAIGHEHLSSFSGKGYSSFLIGGLVNKVLSEKDMRTPVPTDNLHKEILPQLPDETYSIYLNAFDIRPTDQFYKDEAPILSDIINLASEHKGSAVTEPFRIQGFYIVPDESKGGFYKIRIEPAPHFRVIEDKNLYFDRSPMFNVMNENGIVIPDEKGKYMFSKSHDKLGGREISRNGHLEGSMEYLDTIETTVPQKIVVIKNS